MRPTVPPDYPDDAIAEPVHRGRGALSNETSRFDTEKRIRTTDGWETEASAAPAEDDELPPLRTTLTRDTTRTIIARNDLARHRLRPLDQSLSRLRARLHLLLRAADPRLSRACRRASISRPSIFVQARRRAAARARSSRSRDTGPTRSRWAPTPIPTSRSSASCRSRAQILEVLARFRHPVGHRDQVRAGRPATSTSWAPWPAQPGRGLVSVTTLDRDLARAMEPRASTPERRLETIRALSAAGIPTGVLDARR